jgi:hypothetical protein
MLYELQFVVLSLPQLNNDPLIVLASSMLFGGLVSIKEHKEFTTV